MHRAANNTPSPPPAPRGPAPAAPLPAGPRPPGAPRCRPSRPHGAPRQGALEGASRRPAPRTPRRSLSAATRTLSSSPPLPPGATPLNASPRTQERSLTASPPLPPAPDCPLQRLRPRIEGRSLSTSPQFPPGAAPLSAAPHTQGCSPQFLTSAAPRGRPPQAPRPASGAAPLSASAPHVMAAPLSASPPLPAAAAPLSASCRTRGRSPQPLTPSRNGRSPRFLTSLHPKAPFLSPSRGAAPSAAGRGFARGTTRVRPFPSEFPSSASPTWPGRAPLP